MRTNVLAVLVKVKSVHNNVKKDVYTGWLHDKPSIGCRFEMATREEGLLRTTEVKVIRFISENVTEFDTGNSTYRLTYVKDDLLGDEFYISPLERDLLEVFVKQHITSNLAIIGYLKELEKKLCGNYTNA